MVGSYDRLLCKVKAMSDTCACCGCGELAAIPHAPEHRACARCGCIPGEPTFAERIDAGAYGSKIELPRALGKLARALVMEKQKQVKR